MAILQRHAASSPTPATLEAAIRGHYAYACCHLRRFATTPPRAAFLPPQIRHAAAAAPVSSPPQQAADIRHLENRMPRYLSEREASAPARLLTGYRHHAV